MHITILTYGSHGDIRPYIALGRGLKQAGYSIRVATHAHYQPFVNQYDLDFADAGGDPRQILASKEGQNWVESGQNVFQFVRHVLAMGKNVMNPMLEQAWLACQNTDAIIFSVFGIPGYHIAEKLGIPCMAAWLQPLSPTREFASPAIPPGWEFGSTFNRLTHNFISVLTWLPFRAVVNAWRTETLHLPPMGLRGPLLRFRKQEIPIMYGYSPSVIPPPTDWPSLFSVTGYWFLDRDDDWQPPADLVDFLEEGPPPVYIGFGSMPSRDPEALLDLGMKALETVGQRGVLLAGWSGLKHHGEQPYLNRDIFIVEAVPHDWLFPQMAAVVHHGGAGTTAAALRAGVPSIISPFFADQPFWGHRVARLGVGPKPIMRKNLTVANLTAAIRQSINKNTMRQRAAEIGRNIRAEDGIARAVEVVKARLG
ncbi:MAG: glycosyltransferase family 1 protein [Anaerolineae bacterium]|nr:glycosyltransferase family 1 protein [Anaerolineae bacterium]